MITLMKCAESTDRRVKSDFKAFGLSNSMNGIIGDTEFCRGGGFLFDCLL